MYDLMWDAPVDQRPSERRSGAPRSVTVRVSAPWIVRLPFRFLRAGVSLLRRAPA
jgi:hypothetical protein